MVLSLFQIVSVVNFLCGSGYILKEADGGIGTGNNDTGEVRNGRISYSY